jgi:hypothetical protein
VIGGVHLHHQVFGIFAMLVAGTALIATTPAGAPLDALSALFGAGAGLTFDEFALWLHVDDVYWAKDGRKSIDATFAILAITGAFASNVGLATGWLGAGSWPWEIVAIGANLLLSLVCLSKGKPIVAAVGVFTGINLFGAVRLAKPTSSWARRRYIGRPKRQARAERRFGERYERRWNRFRDLVAGATTPS